MIGSTVNVWGRSLLICDCDQFTKEFYRTKYGIGMHKFIGSSLADYFHRSDVVVVAYIDSFAPVEIPKPEVSPIKKVIPPHIGIGTEEDTMASVLDLIPKQPRK